MSDPLATLPDRVRLPLAFEPGPLAADLAAWCHRAEASGIAGLREFSTRLRAARA